MVADTPASPTMAEAEKPAMASSTNDSPSLTNPEILQEEKVNGDVEDGANLAGTSEAAAPEHDYLTGFKLLGVACAYVSSFQLQDMSANADNMLKIIHRIIPVYTRDLNC